MNIKIIVAIFVLLTLVGCAAFQPQPVSPPTERPAGPLPPTTKPTYNLMGYPPAAQEGYIDGCETAKESEWAFKDVERYETDGQYRTGWDDGYSICNNKNKR